MKRNPFLPALILALAVVSLTILFPQVPPAKGIKSPVIEMEFARSPETVDAVTGYGTEQQETIVDAFRRNTAHDRWFILAYSFFLAVSCAIAWKQGGQPVLLAGAALALAAGVFDFAENRHMMWIWDRLGGDFNAALSRLHLLTWLKWASLGLVFCTLAPFAWRRGVAGKILAGGAVLNVGAGIAAAVMRQPVYYIVFSLTIMLCFVLLLVFALTYRLVKKA